MKRKTWAYIFLTAILTAVSCSSSDKGTAEVESKNMNQLVISDDFDWSTTRNVTFQVQALDNMDQPISGARINIYTDDPLEGGNLIVSGLTDESGLYIIDYEVPAYYDSLFVSTDYVGLPSPGEVVLNPDGFSIVLGGMESASQVQSTIDQNRKMLSIDFGYLGGFDRSGVPDYLEPDNDEISKDFLNDINNTLPERQTLTTSHPEYLQSGLDYNLNLIGDCDVWITFVHEGAGYKNELGFYSYPTGQTPQTSDDIKEITIIFPNVSYEGSGGGLYSGNKVYIGRFNSGTSIGFALMANGWDNQVTSGVWTVFSDPDLNPESKSDLRQHTVLVNDNGRNLFLLGFEDILRDNSSCDHDFNDAVFYVTANPVGAIDQSRFPNIDYTGKDSDEDGVPDAVDHYPDDPGKAFNNYFPGQGSYGTLAFEDLWPLKGDYDFNDAVIDYNFNQITNADNDLVEIQATFILRAHGARYHNGFGFQMPFDKSLILSVTGDMQVSGEIVTLDDRNLESDQTLPVVIVWEDAYEVLPKGGNEVGVNTDPQDSFETPDEMSITIALNSPVSLAKAGIPPYNPFIFIDGKREVEVHLVDRNPTDLESGALFRSGEDDSDPASGRYYRTQDNLPWAINIAESLAYPVEKADITTAYTKFAAWAESKGDLFPDWYRNQDGYRNDGNIYK